MTYKDKLKPWIIVVLIPPCRWEEKWRFANRSDAEEFLKLVKRDTDKRYELVSISQFSRLSLTGR
ncbi:MAG: hypothetical protein WBF90_38745 [Rivularia sp. (in: cyanobacteria)]